MLKALRVKVPEHRRMFADRATQGFEGWRVYRSLHIGSDLLAGEVVGEIFW